MEEDRYRIYELKKEIDKVSDELTRKANEIDGDVMTIRNHPEIKKIWNELCTAGLSFSWTIQRILRSFNLTMKRILRDAKLFREMRNSSERLTILKYERWV